MNNALAARRCRFALAGVVFAILLAACSSAQEDGDLSALLDGVKDVAYAGNPGPVVVFGDRAFTIVEGQTGKTRAAAVAAGRAQKGRVVFFGHGGYVERALDKNAANARLFENAVVWAAGGSKSKGSVLGGARVLEFLAKRGFAATEFGKAKGFVDLAGVAVIVASAADLTPKEAKAVEAFVRSGGGFVGTDLGWGWLQTHPGKRLADHPGSALYAAAGLAIADGTITPMPIESRQPSHRTHAGRAFDRLVAAAKTNEKLPKDEAAQLGSIVVAAAHALPESDDTLLPRLRAATAEAASDRIPTAAKPLTAADFMPKLRIILEHVRREQAPPDAPGADPAAAAFPGSVLPEAPRVSKLVPVLPQTEGWISTGLYAAPGEVVTVDVEDGFTERALRLRIGAHTDRLWDKDKWSRHPEIARSYEVTTKVFRAANPFGGLVYLERRKDAVGTIVCKVSGAVEAPHFVRGETSLEAWKSKIRNAPAPWAEIAGRKIVVTLPASEIRTLDDPEAVLEVWDRALDCYAVLGSRPLTTRPERMVADVQISAGYMHSGYPIMTHLDVTPHMVNRDALLGAEHTWGFWHELGHNKQRSEWTFEGTGEVTNNVFALFVTEQLAQKPVRAQMRAPVVQVRDYLKKGGDFEQWKREPFLALEMYAEVQETFGWDAFKKVFAAYRDLPKGELPKTDDEKRDQWLVRLSRAVGRDLSPFFKRWAVPVSAAAEKSLADLPPWAGPEPAASQSTR